MSKILRVNMTELTAKYEDVPEKYKLMGGRWLTSSIVADEVKPTCHPLGAQQQADTGSWHRYWYSRAYQRPHLGGRQVPFDELDQGIKCWY